MKNLLIPFSFSFHLDFRIIRCTALFAIFFLFLSNANSQTNQLQQLKEDSLLKLASKHLYNNPDSVRIYSKVLLKKGAQGNLKAEGIHYRLEGFLCALSYKTDSMEFYFNKAVTIFEQLDDLKTVSKIHNTSAQVYRSSAQYEKAMESIFRSVEINEKLKYNKAIAYSYWVLSDIYEFMDNFEKAIEYGEKAADLQKEADAPLSLARTYRTLSGAYSSNGQLDKADEIIDRGLDVFFKNPSENSPEKYLLQTQRGIVYNDMGKLDLALASYRKALEYIEKFNDPVSKNITKMKIGEVYLARNRFKEAITIFEEILIDTESSKNEVSKVFLYSKLSDAYTQIGNFEKAYNYENLFRINRDSVNLQKIKSLETELEVKYEADKKEAQIVQQETQIAQQKKTQLLTLGFAGILGLLLAGLFFAFRKNQKQKTVIETKSQQNELLLKEIHHRVKNNLQTISSLLYLQSAHITDAEIKEAVAEGQHRVESMALIHQKLYQRENLAAIEMKDYLTNLGDSLISTFVRNPERIKLKINMSELELDVDTAVPLGLIANELITNSIKYAFPENREGEISLKMSKNDSGSLEFLVADNGIGEENTENGTAFGSQLIHLLTKQLNGKIEQGTDIGYWTKIVL